MDIGDADPGPKESSHSSSGNDKDINGNALCIRLFSVKMMADLASISSAADGSGCNPLLAGNTFCDCALFASMNRSFVFLARARYSSASFSSKTVPEDSTVDDDAADAAL
jgi:hypothetical protein